MFIKRLALKKILSFNDAEIELGPLNVLIGPNAVGKSNLIEVIGVLQAAPNSLMPPILRGGGVRQWLWLGGSRGENEFLAPGAASSSPIAGVECELNLPRGSNTEVIRYELSFSEQSSALIVLREKLTGDAGTYFDRPSSGQVELPQQLSPREQQVLRMVAEGKTSKDIAVTLNLGLQTVRSYRKTMMKKLNVSNAAGLTKLFLEGAKPPNMNLPPGESFFSQFRNPADTTPITELGRRFSQIRIYREFRSGANSPARYGISTSVPKDALADGSDNLALVLHDLDFHGARDRIRNYLHRFCERFEDVKIDVGDGLARIYLREAGLAEMLPAVRMSDGTLKFLSLLAALFNPKPPPLMCIEEPEVGLHPDALQLVAEALVEASESVQLIVTTHSEALVDALSDRPESVLVCERDFDNGTQMKRLSKERLKVWLEHYSLGQLWRNGEIGGGRW